MKRFPLCLFFLLTLPGLYGAFSWQDPNATVLPNGGLEYRPEPYAFQAGASNRYIDFEAGNDHASGTQAEPWKHHPWDPQASGKARAAANETHTYIFKGGVTYRGSLKIPNEAVGTPEEPLSLTRDPAWGDGPAVLNGADIVTGWQQQAHPAMPESDKVWMAEIDFLPRAVWLTHEQGEPIRFKLARWPNWTESNPNDLMSEWPTWEQPEWWKEKNKIMVKGTRKHLGIDAELPRPLGDLEGGTVWSEWGIVMGSPYPAKIEAVDEKRGGIAFRGPWTREDLEKIITGNRYYLEDLPQFLDEPGEFWVERLGKNKARLYLRLPQDANPQNYTIEAARHVRILHGQRANHLEVSGLTFRFTNIGWDYNDPQWADPDLIAGAIHIRGPGPSLSIHHNTFEHVNMPVRVSLTQSADQLELVSICDNDMRDTDHGAVEVANFSPRQAGDMGQLGHVDLLRNRLERIGMRNLSGSHGHAVQINFPATSHLAGNFLYRIAGWGLAVWGGKPSGNRYAGIEAPMSRHLIHHNRVEDVLLKSNDWGGIETWQGGTHYIFNNIVINSLGFKNWTFKPGDSNSVGSFGHAYYLDGSFKNYLFNNIGQGLNNELGTKGVNITAIQNIFSFENWYFNNSFHRFAETTRQQAPEAGRFRYLGNVFSDTSRMLFRHAKPEGLEPDANASHFNQIGNFDYATIAYYENVITELSGSLGTFEENGVVHQKGETFSHALEKLGAQASSIGVFSDQPVLLDPDKGDWRPIPNSLATKQNVLVFVPWGLARTVGEWQFTLNHAQPNEVIDEHWFMTSQYAERKAYRLTPRYALVGQNIAAADFTSGPLSNWTSSALEFNGQDQYLSVANDTLPKGQGKSKQTTVETKTADLGFASITYPAAITPGQSYAVTVKLNQPADAKQFHLHIHWMKSGSWGGFSDLGQNPEDLGNGTLRYQLKAKLHDNLAAYNLIGFLSPDGSWEKKSASKQVGVPVGSGIVVEDATPRSVDVADTSFIVEVHFNRSGKDGVLVSKMADGVGYRLSLEEGRAAFRVQTSDGTKASVRSEKPISQGQWTHLMAECDRQANQLRLYIDGKLAVEAPAKLSGSLSNRGDFLVGGGPGLDNFSGQLDFLRVALSTLAESATSIEELYAWQFEGPQYFDFAGHNRRQHNAAGALAQ